MEISYSISDLKNNFSYINITDSNLTIHLSFDVQENSSLNITGDSSGYLNNGTLGNATLTVQTIYEEILSSEKESVSEEIKEIVEENKWIWILIGVVGLGVLGFVGVRVFRKK